MDVLTDKENDALNIYLYNIGYTMDEVPYETFIKEYLEDIANID